MYPYFNIMIGALINKNTFEGGNLFEWGAKSDHYDNPLV